MFPPFYPFPGKQEGCGIILLGAIDIALFSNLLHPNLHAVFSDDDVLALHFLVRGRGDVVCDRVGDVSHAGDNEEDGEQD